MVVDRRVGAKGLPLKARPPRFIFGKPNRTSKAAPSTTLPV